MEKIVRQNMLFDFYGELLTKHQQDVYQDAVFNDMSLAEVAEEYGISRQAAHDLIKRCDRLLNAYEEKLHMIERFSNVKDKLAEAERIIDEAPIGDGSLCGYMEELKIIINDIEDIIIK